MMSTPVLSIWEPLGTTHCQILEGDGSVRGGAFKKRGDED